MKSVSRSLRLRHGSGPRSGHFNGLAKAGLMLAANLPKLHSAPVWGVVGPFEEEDGGEEAKKPTFWLYFSVAVVLVLLGGVFAGLTLGLMGQDEIYLQVIQQSGEGTEKKNAARVLRLLKRGKHWVLVTLLLSNVITNETLPIVLDRSLGGGWPAVLSSTVLIVIFGEIIPQSVCVRYGLGIGAYLSPFVLGLMYLMWPVAYPTALLLDYILGEDHGTTYKKAGLKTLVTLHKTLGPSPSDRLNQDEVTIISAVLDLKDKPVGSIMTPIKDVFIMSSDTVLDDSTMHRILSAGYSRIPIHSPGEPTNFIGMLLVKVLITYDPEDAKKVSEFPLATLPETSPETSCLDIVNFFQEGKSHMVLVSETPAQNSGALGVVTLEDVIEELIGEEIVDESDVYIDVHKAIRRVQPSPLSFGGARRSINTQYMSKQADPSQVAQIASAAGSTASPSEQLHVTITNGSEHPSRAATPANNITTPSSKPAEHQSSSLGIPDGVMAHLTLGPANLAGNPKQTKSKTVKIKQAGASTTDPAGAAARALLRGTDENSRMGSASPSSAPEGQPKDYGSINGTAVDGTETDGANGGTSPEDQRRAEQRKYDDIGMGSHRIARSGSLVERIEEVGGVSKTVIEPSRESTAEDAGAGSDSSGSGRSGRSRKSNKSEKTPLLGGGTR